MNGTLKTWLKGLIAAVVGGAANAVSAVIAARETFNFSPAGLIAIAKLAAAGALIALVSYLKQSPVPNGPVQ